MSAVFRGMKAGERAAIVEAMAKRARAAGLSQAEFWQAALDFWAPTAIVTPSSLVADAIKFAGVLNMPVGANTEAVLSTACQPVKRRARVRRSRSQGSQGTTLPLADTWSRDAVAAIFDAASALLQLYGVGFNTLIVLRHDLLHRDEAHGALEVSDLAHEANQQLRREAGPQARFHYIYRHRKTDRDGFTTAVICHVPPLWADPMRGWIDGFIERRFGTRHDRRAVHIRMTDHGDTKSQIRRHWRLVRGLAGTLDPAIEVVHEGQRRRLVDVLGVPAALRCAGQPLGLRQRYRLSETIGAGAQARASRERLACLSAFRDQAWSFLTTGWELAEYDERRREVGEREQALAAVMAHWPEGPDARHNQIRQAELDRIRASWPEDPRRRLRSWRGWWLPQGILPG